jgi:hypothetical protein
MRKRINKIFLSFLILTFFLANVGFTIVLHYCDMMKQTSSSQCGMCDVEEETSNLDFFNHLISDISEESCCKDFVKTTEKIDNVILKKSDTKELESTQFISILFINPRVIHNSFALRLVNVHSPPEKIPLHLINSILLI